MQRLRLFFGLAAILISLVATAADGQPTQELLAVGPEGEWTLTRQYVVTLCVPESYEIKVKVPVTVQEDIQVDGKIEKRIVTAYKEETRTATRMRSLQEVKIAKVTVDPKTARAFETDGKPIQAEDVARRCASGRLVVVSPSDEMITANYAGLFKPGTVILALPPRGYGDAAPVPAGPVPAAPPQVPAAPAVPRSGAIGPRTSVTPVSFPNSKAILPAAPAPELVFVSREGADGLKIRQYQEFPSTTEVTVLENDSSIAPDRPVMAPQVRRRSRTSIVPLKAIRASYPSEGNLSQDQIKEKLGQAEITAVLSSDGRLVDEFWLQNFRSDVLILRGVRLPSDLPMAVPAVMPQPVLPQPAPGVPIVPQPVPPQPVPKGTEA